MVTPDTMTPEYISLRKFLFFYNFPNEISNIKKQCSSSPLNNRNHSKYTQFVDHQQNTYFM
jgi:hypothetical protein